MDFFENQDQAYRRTRWLVMLFALAVTGIIAAMYLVAAHLFLDGDEGLWDPALFAGVAFAVSVVVGGGSLFKTMQLSKGGDTVALSLGGRPVAPDTPDADERKLLNVVEEMSLAAGIAVPRVYLLEHEEGINAFAAGFTIQDAVIGVTRGCVQKLTRDELQGVIAHEFSHIINGDMRLNIRLMGVLFGILMLAIIGRVQLNQALWSSGRRSRNNRKQGIDPQLVIGLALLVIGYIGVFVAGLIKSAISRQREYLSDASAVQFTRNPAGISGALKKIGGYEGGTKVRNEHASEASHMFFGPVGGLQFLSLFSTHPPLAERIRRLDPAFLAERTPRKASATSSGGGSEHSALSGFTASQAGNLDLDAAAAVLHSIPDSLRNQAHELADARAIIYGLLLSSPDNPPVRTLQDEAIRNDDPAALDRTLQLYPDVFRLPPEARLPLAELAVPALRGMTFESYQQFSQTVKALTTADQEIDLFEFALSHLILQHVESAFRKSATSPVQYRTIASVRAPLQTVLTGFSVWGTDTHECAGNCFQAGWKALADASVPPAFNAEQADLEKVSAALEMLQKSTPAVKRKIVDACSACVHADGKVTLEQAELMRAVSSALDIPSPPLQITDRSKSTGKLSALSLDYRS